MAVETNLNGSSNGLYQPSVIKLAQTGDVRAIAYWLNGYLEAQGLYAQVGVEAPGRFLVLVECDQVPDRDRLVRLVCQRLCQLNSAVVTHVRILARAMGHAEPLWEQSVRLLTPANRQQKQPRTSLAPTRRIIRHLSTSLVEAMPSPTEVFTQSLTLFSNRSFSQRLQDPRVVFLAGAAIVAFLIGCGVEALNHQLPASLVRPTNRERPESRRVQATPVETATTRGRRAGAATETVQAALETVSVIQQPVLAPHDPTITLILSPATALGAAQSSSNRWWPGRPSGMTDYQQADVVMVSLAEARGDRLSLTSSDPQTLVQHLVNNGVDLVNLVGDRSRQAIGNSAEALLNLFPQANIHSLGAGRDPKANRRPQIFNVKGQRIAYLGYADADLRQAGDAAEQQIAADIRAIRGQVDWVVVNYRWSRPLSAQPASWQTQLAHLAVDKGADLVVGYHPAVTQGAEVYKGRAIVYSLGDDGMTAAGTSTDADYDTIALKVSLRDRQMQLDFLPIQVRQSQARRVAAERGASILQQLEAASAQFEQPLHSATVLDAQLMPALRNSTPTDSSNPFITYPTEQEDGDGSPSDAFPGDAAPDGLSNDNLPNNNLPNNNLPVDSFSQPDRRPYRRSEELPAERFSEPDVADEEPLTDHFTHFPEESPDFYPEDY